MEYNSCTVDMKRGLTIPAISEGSRVIILAGLYEHSYGTVYIYDGDDTNTVFVLLDGHANVTPFAVNEVSKI